MNDKLLKGLGIGATIAGFGATLVSTWVGDQKRDAVIEEKVNEALAKKEREES